MRKFIALIVLVLLPSFVLADATPANKVPFEDDGTTKEQLLGVMPDDIVVGDLKAPVTIIEYASMSCSHCAIFHNDTYKKLKAKYVDTGQVRFILRDFPLNEPALRGSMLARCAGPDRFEKFNEVLFSTQSNWVSRKNYIEILSNIGKLGGLTGDEFDACMQDKALEEQIMKTKYYGVTKLSVRSTPTFFINGEEHKGAKPLDYFSNVIDRLLANGGGKVAPVSDEAKDSPEKTVE